MTGAVGQEIIDVLGNRKFPVSAQALCVGALRRQADGDALGELPIEEFTLEAARACDVVFLAVSGDFALEWVPKLTADEARS